MQKFPLDVPPGSVLESNTWMVLDVRPGSALWVNLLANTDMRAAVRKGSPVKGFL